MPVVTEEIGDGQLLFPKVRRNVLRHIWTPRRWSFGSISPRKLPEDPKAFIETIQARIELDITQKLAQVSAASSTGQTSGGQTISDGDLSELAVQTWRLEKRINNLDPEEHKRIRKQLADSARRFKKILERFNVEFEDLTGRPFVTGWQEVEVVAWEEPEGKMSPVEAGPWVSDTMSPLVRREGRTIKTAQIVCVDVEEN